MVIETLSHPPRSVDVYLYFLLTKLVYNIIRHMSHPSAAQMARRSCCKLGRDMSHEVFWIL